MGFLMEIEIVYTDEIPGSCRECKFYLGMCGITKRKLHLEDYYTDTGRPEWCPLTEYPGGNNETE